MKLYVKEYYFLIVRKNHSFLTKRRNGMMNICLMFNKVYLRLFTTNQNIFGSS